MSFDEYLDNMASCLCNEERCASCNFIPSDEENPSELTCPIDFELGEKGCAFYKELYAVRKAMDNVMAS